MVNFLDTASDLNGVMLHRILHTYNPPPFVKQANTESDNRIDPDLLDSTVFADPINRRYPCNTKAATWLNYAYFLENRKEHPTHRDSEIEKNFRKFSSIWGIELPEPIAEQKQASLEIDDIEQAPPEKFAFYMEKDGNVIAQYAMTSPEKIVQSAVDFTGKSCWMYPAEIRKEIAEKLWKAAEEQGVELDDLTRANLDLLRRRIHVHPKEAAQKIRARYEYHDAAVREQAEKLADRLELMKISEVTPEFVDGLVDCLATLDKQAGYDETDRGKYLLPERILGYPECALKKLAESAIELGGRYYLPEDLQRVKPECWESVLGKEAAADVTDPFTGEIDGKALKAHLDKNPAKVSAITYIIDHTA